MHTQRIYIRLSEIERKEKKQRNKRLLNYSLYSINLYHHNGTGIYDQLNRVRIFFLQREQVPSDRVVIYFIFFLNNINIYIYLYRKRSLYGKRIESLQNYNSSRYGRLFPINSFRNDADALKRLCEVYKSSMGYRRKKSHYYSLMGNLLLMQK